MERRAKPRSTTLVVVIIGLVITGAMTFATWSVHDSNEKRLLNQRTREAAAVLTAALPSIQTPLGSAAVLAEATDGNDAQSFQQLMDPLVRNHQPFVTASIWALVSGHYRPILTAGTTSKMESRGQSMIDAFFQRSTQTATLGVFPLLHGKDPRLGYSYTVVGAPVRYIAYAESAIPADRKEVVAKDSPFTGLDNAIYLGKREVPAALIAATTRALPLKGRRAKASVAFGDTSLMIVASPTTELGGSLLADLPWIVALVGLVGTASGAVLVDRLLRRRTHAEDLAARNAVLLAEQRSVAQTLQHSLLPDRLPHIPGFVIGGRYHAGAEGVDIGGDWYDVVAQDDGRFLIVVGDVSGRGLPAATVMASLRFAIRAFASQGDSPAVILTKLNSLADFDGDGRFATVLCAAFEMGTGEITVANAGHPPPIVVEGGQARFLDTTVGTPVGVVAEPHYSSVTMTLGRQATFLAFTDGLFERQGETIQVGMERLRRSSADAPGTLEETLDVIIEKQGVHRVKDDTAILGVQWLT
ncbi:MAG: Two component signal transduction histidine kinase [Actinomycetia bacterium]|nr:Two component signal transduction histidine kinase [Actinomycetes bacterium]